MHPPFFQASAAARNTILVCIYIFVLALLPHLGSHFDMEYWKQWAAYNTTYGLSHAYLSGTDYTPLYHYVLYLYGLIQGSEEAIARHIFLLKAFTFLFDIGGLWLVYRWLDRKIDLLFLILVSIFNLGYIYNTLFWGQVDAIEGFLLFFSLYAAGQKKTVLSFMMMVLALNFKLQAMVLLPIWGLILLNNLITERNFRSLLLGILAAFLLQVLILLPFVQTQESAAQMVSVLFSAVGRYHHISVGAYNFWIFVADAPFTTADTELFFAGLSYRQFGLIAFFFASITAMIPLLSILWRNLSWGRKEELPRRQIWLASALVVLLFFYLNTEMHERYTHPAFLFLIAYCFQTRRFFSLVLFSLAYLLNLEDVLGGLRLPNYNTFIFSRRLIAALYGICMLYLFLRLFQGLSESRTQETQSPGMQHN